MELPSVSRSEEKISYSVRQAAELSDLSERSIWRLIRDKKLPVCKIGKRCLITRKSLISFIESQQDASGLPVRPAPPHIQAKVSAAKGPGGAE
jgi:excisionase family DNA binding protein